MEAKKRQKWSALILDDEAPSRQILRIVLEHTFALTIYEASTNDEAWQILRRHKIDIITTDIIHPDANGVEFIREVRKHPYFLSIPILVVSAVHREYSSELSFLNVLSISKPFYVGEVINFIGMILHMKKDPDLSLLDMGTELPALDYKFKVDIKSNDGRAAIAKDIIAMANSGGGTIIVGVREVSPGQFKKVGVSAASLQDFEVSIINKAIRKFMTPSVPIAVRRVIVGKRTFVFLEVPSIDDEIILVAKMNTSASIYPGRIYIRTTASESAELQDAVVLRRMIDRLIKYRISILLNR